jgi:hypothetical protein
MRYVARSRFLTRRSDHTMVNSALFMASSPISAVGRGSSGCYLTASRSFPTTSLAFFGQPGRVRAPVGPIRDAGPDARRTVHVPCSSRPVLATTPEHDRGRVAECAEQLLGRVTRPLRRGPAAGAGAARERARSCSWARSTSFSPRRAVGQTHPGELCRLLAPQTRHSTALYEIRELGYGAVGFGHNHPTHPGPPLSVIRRLHGQRPSNDARVRAAPTEDEATSTGSRSGRGCERRRDLMTSTG